MRRLEEKTQAQRNAEVQAVANRQVQFMYPRYIQGSIHDWQRVANRDLTVRLAETVQIG